MIIDHQDLIMPDSGTRLFRFCPFDKFESLINQSSLYFRHISEFKDKSEGKYTDADIPIINHALGLPYEAPQRDPFDNLYYVNCWTEGTPSDERFWKEYAPGKDGLAIASTPERIRGAFSSDKSNDVLMSHVWYIDRSSQLTFKSPQWAINIIERCFAKDRDCFSWEKEVRLLHILKNTKEASVPSGIFMPIELNVLIDSVFVSPFAEDNQVQRINEFLARNNLANIPIVKALLG